MLSYAIITCCLCSTRLSGGFTRTSITAMPPRTVSTSRAKHKSTLRLESPPPKKFKGAKDVTILSVRRYYLHSLRTLPLTFDHSRKLSQRPVLKPGNKPSSSAPHLSNVTVKDAKGKGKVTRSLQEEIPGTLQLITLPVPSQYTTPRWSPLGR